MTELPTLAVHELHEGGGVPLVLIHAFPIDHRMWIGAAELLPETVRAIAVDLPGQGYSEPGNLAPRIELAADAVHATRVDAGIGNAVVAGLSMGGYVALALAESHPEFVYGLGLIDTKATADDPGARDGRLKVAKDMEMDQSVQAVMALPARLLGATSLQQRRNLLPMVESWIHAQSPHGLAWAQRMMAARPDRTHVITAFDGPIAVVVGAEDVVTPPSDAEHMAAHGRDVDYAIVDGAGHLSALEDPRAVAEVLARLHHRAVAGRGHTGR
jgi:pimeloyl-ACP methyl ester carboxylesterase